MGIFNGARKSTDRNLVFSTVVSFADRLATPFPLLGFRFEILVDFAFTFGEIHRCAVSVVLDFTLVVIGTWIFEI